MTDWMVWSIVLLWVAFVVLALFMIGLLYQQVDIQRRLGPDMGALMPSDGLEVGATAPDFTALDKRSGHPVQLADYAGRQLLLAFLSPKCRPCQDLVPRLNRFAKERGDTPIVVVGLEDGGTVYGRTLSKRIAVVGDADKRIQTSFEVGRTPLVYLLDKERRVANRTVTSSLVDLEDTLDGRGRPQGNAVWVPREAEIAQATSPTSEGDTWADPGPQERK